MRTLLHICLALILFFCFGAKGYAQAPVANFTISPDSGCSPLVVTFFSTSTGSPTNYEWDFGDGTQSFLPLSATHTYNIAGTYTVKLKVTNASGNNTKTIINAVTVLPSPIVNFSGTPLSGCPPLLVNFTDNSNPNYPGPATYDWSFGTGIPSTAQNPAHTFSVPGYYHITLKVTNAAGCYSSTLKTQYVQVFAPPVADFTYTSMCTAPGTTTFSTTVTGTGPYTYNWDYGDGNTATGNNPTHTYATGGTYNARLIVSDPNGCKDTVIKPVNVGTLQASFTMPPGVACIGAPVNFTNTSISGVFYVWNFGDGNTSIVNNPSYTYNTPGTYNVTLVAIDGGSICKDTVTMPITVSAGPTANFSTSPAIPCPSSDTMFFINLSVGAVSYLWNFDDGSSPSTAANPYHIYNFDSTYTITLKVTDINGCSDTVTKADTMYKTELNIYAYPINYNHCVPTTISFADTLMFPYFTLDPPIPFPEGWLYADLPVTMTSLSWDFGDGTAPFVGHHPSHTYTYADTFTVVATATTSNGCTLTDTFLIHVDTKPVANFTMNNDTLCIGDTLLITDLSIGSTSAVYFEYPPGPPIIVANTSPAHPQTFYAPAYAGLYTIEMWAYNNTCVDTFRLTQPVFAKGPTATPRGEVDCDTPKLVRFKDITAHRISSRLWSFGDGATDTAKNPTHIYSSFGTYTVSLTVHDDSTGCTNVSRFDLKLYVPTANFWANDTAVCLKDTIHLSQQFSDPVAYYGYSISPFLGVGANYPPPTKWYTFDSAGLYTIKLEFIDDHACLHDTTKTNYILVADPDPDIFATPNPGCSPLTTILTENGTNTPGAFATNRNWTFGDNTTASVGSASTPHTYAPGKFTVKVVVTDNVGCTDSLTKLLYIESHKTTAAFTANDTTACMGDTITFSNKSSSATASPLTYTWDFGDGSPIVSSKKDTTHVYNQTGAFTVRLIAVDNLGCADTLIRTGYIKVTKPVASFTMNDTLALCPPLIAQFTNTSTSAVTYNWIFGDGSNSQVPNPSNIYSNPGKYNITLIAKDSHGCTDTAFGSAEVMGYAGGLTYTPLSGCNPLQVSFKANLANITNFLWDFSDGTVVAATGDTTTHTYTSAGKYLPKMVFTDSAGCVNSSSGNDTIRVDDVIGDFVVSPACINTPVTFKDTSFSFFSQISGWIWNINNGQATGNQSTTSITFANTGTYPVVLIVRNANGCSDTISENITILPLPTIKAGLDTVICIGDAAILMASGGVSYEWSPNVNLSCNTCQTTNASPPSPMNYIVTGTDVNGCKNKDTVRVNIQIRTTSEVEPGGEICADSSFQLSASGAQRYEWKPAESLDNPNIANPLASPDVTTSYTVLAYEGTCPPDSHAVSVIVHPLPTVAATGTETIVAGNMVNLNASGTNIHSYLWTPVKGLSCETCSSPVANPTATTTYVVTVSSDFGCKASDSVTIKVLCDQSQLFIPNTFSPNGDGDNDVFYPRGLGLQSIRAFRIYNRWGEMVYERKGIQLNDAASAWDGTGKGNLLNPDVFVYVIEGICDGGELMIWKGDITLIR